MSSWEIRLAPGGNGIATGLLEGIEALVHDATEVDRVSPIDDQVRLDLAHPSEAFVHIFAIEDNQVLGYAHVDHRSDAKASGHLVVTPTRRREGIGGALGRSMLQAADKRWLATWAHGNTPGAQALAASLGWSPNRELRQLILPLSTSITDATYPDGVTVRTFEPGRDEEAWVRVNAAAFAQHPEQGRVSVDELRQREEQTWFDPAGLFLAERDGVLLGSHWTKIHEHGDGSRVGEVYVVGVSPQAQGLGLGKALTLTGLNYLRDQSLDVILYVDAENTSAVALYERLGFDTLAVDVMYAADQPGRRS